MLKFPSYPVFCLNSSFPSGIGPTEFVKLE